MLTNPFHETFRPSELLHREKEKTKLEKIFDRSVEVAMWRNAFVRGFPGSGKTETLKAILKERDPDSYLFVSAREASTPVRVLQAIADSPHQTVFRLLPTIQEQLAEKPRVIIIDEVDKVARFDELFNHLCTIARNVPFPLIIASNRIVLLDNIPSDVKQTFFFEIHEFDRYDASQLKDIVLDRVKQLPEKVRTRIPEEAVAYACATEVKSGEGSARIVLKVMESCLMENTWDYVKMDDMLEDLRAHSWKAYYNKLSANEKNFLAEILQIFVQKEGKPFLPVDIAKVLPGHSPARISQLVTTFEKQGIITTSYVNKGRGGRYRLINFASPETFEQLLAIT